MSISFQANGDGECSIVAAAYGRIWCKGRLAWSKSWRPSGTPVLLLPKWTRVNSCSGSSTPATRQHCKHCRGYYYHYIITHHEAHSTSRL